MTSNFRTTLIAAAVSALMAAPLWAADDARSTGATTGTTGTTGAATGTPGATAPSDSPYARDTPTRSQSAPADQTLGAQEMEGPLYSRTADDITGMEIVDLQGEDIGTVDSVVLGPDREKAHAIISVGGLLGMGGRNVMVSLDELQLEGEDRLKVNTSREQLESRPEVSDEQKESYVELTGERPLRQSIQDFAAFEPGQDPGTAGTQRPSTVDRGSDMGGSTYQTTPGTQQQEMNTSPGQGTGTTDTR